MHTLRAAQITHFLGRTPKDLCIGACFVDLANQSNRIILFWNSALSLPKLISIEISISICGAMQIQRIDLVLYSSLSVSLFLSTPRSICPFGALALLD